MFSDDEIIGFLFGKRSKNSVEDDKKSYGLDNKTLGISLAIIGMFFNIFSISPIPKMLANINGIDITVYFLLVGCGMFFYGNDAPIVWKTNKEE